MSRYKLSRSCGGAPRFMHERNTHNSNKNPTIDPMTMPAMAPPLNVTPPLLPELPLDTTVTVASGALWTMDAGCESAETGVGSARVVSWRSNTRATMEPGNGAIVAITKRIKVCVFEWRIFHAETALLYPAHYIRQIVVNIYGRHELVMNRLQVSIYSG